MLKGPEIGLLQGGILWGIIVLALQLIFKPQLAFSLEDLESDPDFQDFKASSDASKSVDDQQFSEHWKRWRDKFGSNSKKKK